MYYRDESILERNCKRLEDNLIVLFRYQSRSTFYFLSKIDFIPRFGLEDIYS